MATIIKVMSSTRFICEQNNFVTYVDTASEHSEFHGMIEYIKKCRLSYTMLEAPTLYYEVIEEIWTNAEYNSGNKVLTFILKGTEHSINSDVINASFKNS